MENGVGSSEVLEKTHLSPGHGLAMRSLSQGSSSPGKLYRLGSTGTQTSPSLKISCHIHKTLISNVI